MHRFIILTAAITVLAAGEGASGSGTADPGAPGAPPASGGGGSMLTSMLPILILFVVVMWFMTRSQRRDEAKRKALIASIKRGDQVVTIGGLHGEVVAVGEGTVDVRALPGDTVLRFNKGAVSNVNVDAATAVKEK